MANQTRPARARPVKVNRTLDRDFGSIRNAIARGMNVGAYGITNLRLKNPSYHWRLVGDRVEHKPTRAERWSWMAPALIDRVFSRGVFGRCVRFSSRALQLEVDAGPLATVASGPDSAEPLSDVPKPTKGESG